MIVGKLKFITRLFALFLVLIIGAHLLNTRMEAIAKAKQLKSISLTSIISLDVSRYKQGAYDPSGKPIGKVLIATVSNAQDILSFQRLLSANMKRDWNHDGVAGTYSIVINTDDGQFQFNGIRIATQEEPEKTGIWIDLGGNKGELVPHLFEWIQKVSNQK